jgi:UDP-glucose 4-epimerase
MEIQRNREDDMKVLITGGAGYIGSIIAGSFKRAGHEPVILDSLINGNREFTRPYSFIQADIADKDALKALWEKEEGFDGVIHCAALTIVPESVASPGLYYQENVTKSLIFFETLEALGCKKVILSGSASVYGNSSETLLTEESPVNPGSPYARTKLIQEQLLEDLCRKIEKGGLRGISLRYFNPVGAAPDLSSGAWKENGSHLIAKLMAHSSKTPFTLTGTNLPTHDGTGLRDYFHVADLARAHVMAMEKFDRVLKEEKTEYTLMNAGSGQGVTVKEFIKAFEKVQGKSVDYLIGPSRPGDVPGGYASIEKIKRLLGWQPEYSLKDAIESALEWEKIRSTSIEESLN